MREFIYNKDLLSKVLFLLFGKCWEDVVRFFFLEIKLDSVDIYVLDVLIPV